MADRRQVEIFSAGCAVCNETITLVENIACPSCEVTIRDMHDPAVAERARGLGIARVPAVVVDGRLAACCADGGPDEQALRETGIGTPMA